MRRTGNSGMRTRKIWTAVAVLATFALVATGCAGGGDEGGTPAPAGVVSAPEAGATLVATDDPAGLALGASERFFEHAAVVVVADPADPNAIARGASIAAAVGAPALLAEGAPSPSPADGPLATEIDRLGAQAVLAVGAVDGDAFAGDLAVVAAPAATDELGNLLGVSLTEIPLEEAAPVDQLAAVSETEVIAAHADEPSPVNTRGELPPLAPAERVAGTTVITDGTPGQAAAAGTAKAAGAAIAVAPDTTWSSETVGQLVGAASIVGFGTGFGDDAEFAWRATASSTGVELPGGGIDVFGSKRYVALYGTPGTPVLGLLGEQDTEATIERAEQYAAEYQALTTDPVLPALEIIVTVASESAGDDGNYSAEGDPETFIPLIEAAQEAGQYVILDFQPGRTDFLTQIREYEELLLYPHVGVALDPEWRIGPDQVHLVQIGTVGIDEVNSVAHYLADLVAEHNLPQKMLVLHQFQLSMIENREGLDQSRPEVAVLIHADGQGSQPDKQATWAALHENAPEGIAWGWKNFIDEDAPMLTPEQTYSQVDPLPELVTYQ